MLDRLALNVAILNLLTATQTRVNSHAAPRDWVKGQIVNATVLDIGRDGTATLQIGERQVPAKLGRDVGIGVGQQVPLRVITSAAEQVVLERVQPSPAPSTAQLPLQALRERLPQTVPIADLVTVLNQAADEPVPQSATPAAVRVNAAVQSVVDELPALEDLVQPLALKRAMQSSGMFLESVLAEATEEELQALLPRDFKAQLLRVVAELPPRSAPTPQGAAAAPMDNSAATVNNRVPTERATELQLPARITAGLNIADAEPLKNVRLGEQVRGGVAQIEVNQLRHITDAAQGNALWRIDLPVRDPAGNLQLMHLEIEERNNSGGGDAPRQWSMSVDVDLEPLGPMHAKVTLIGERVHTVVWANHPQTFALIKDNAQWLQTQLARAGLDAAEVQCLEGRPTPAESASVVAPLVDLHV